MFYNCRLVVLILKEYVKRLVLFLFGRVVGCLVKKILEKLCKLNLLYVWIIVFFYNRGIFDFVFINFKYLIDLDFFVDCKYKILF